MTESPRNIRPLRRLPAVVAALLALCGAASADTLSFTGSLLSSEDQFSTTITLIAPASVTLQTYGFGGGTNAAGDIITPGGFDPFVGIFSGTGSSALFVNGTSDVLTSFSPGCPPAGTVTIGAIPGQCGDVNLQFPSLAAGTYTVILTDGEYLPAAVFETPPAFLGDGFIDLTAGVFQTCFDSNNCNADTANWALDITVPAAAPVPEPSSIALVALVLALAVARAREKK